MKRKKVLGTIITVLLVGAIGTGCSTSAERPTTEAVVTTEAAAAVSSEEITEAASEEKTEEKTVAASEEKKEVKIEGDKNVFVVKSDGEEAALEINYISSKNGSGLAATEVYYDGENVDVSQGGKTYIITLEPDADSVKAEYYLEVNGDEDIKTISINGPDGTHEVTIDSTEEP